MNSLCKFSLLSAGLLLTCAATSSAQTAPSTDKPSAIPVDLDIDEADVQTVSQRRYSYFPSYRRLYGFGGRRGFSSFSVGIGRPFYGGYSRYGFGRYGFGYSRYGFGRYGFGYSRFGIGGLGYPYYSSSLYRLGYYGYGGWYSPYYRYGSWYRPYGFYYRPGYTIYRPYSYLSMPYGYTYGYGFAGYPYAYRTTFSAARVYNFGTPVISTWNGCAPPCYGSYGFGCAPY